MWSLGSGRFLMATEQCVSTAAGDACNHFGRRTRPFAAQDCDGVAPFRLFVLVVRADKISISI